MADLVDGGSDPRTVYETRLAARAAEVARLEGREARLANARLALFVGAGLGAWFLRAQVPPWAVVGPAVALFVVLLVVHERTRRSLRRTRAAVGFYESGLARLDYRFAGSGQSGERWQDDSHPYAVHLDLFGKGSLYELLCGARTQSGRELLARWLRGAASQEEIMSRQEAAAELRTRVDLMEDLATLDARVVEALQSEALVQWATEPARLRRGPWRVIALGLAGAALATAGAAPWIGLLPLTVVLLGQLGVWWVVHRPVKTVLATVDRPSQSLRLALAALVRLERERFDGSRLQEISSKLGGGDPRPSHLLHDLLRRVDALEWRANDIFVPIAMILLWGTNWAYAIEAWRLKHGSEIEPWIRAIGELEALLDLGRYTFERPEHRFPDLVEEGAVFEARALSHPLLAVCVPNDVALSDEQSLIVVTGSNMSGKSTLLRAIGVNVVLAQMGAPVRAEALRMTPLGLGASIHTVDSLQDGASRFYAEIRSIKRAMDVATEHPPGLFLLDELLHGTNSHDRRIGAESIIRGFLDRGALGLVTTHDLALADIADELGSRARNTHFEFTLDDDGEIRFDYTLEPGVVQTGNALEIMRSAGLEI